MESVYNRDENQISLKCQFTEQLFSAILIMLYRPTTAGNFFVCVSDISVIEIYIS